MEHIHSY